MQLSCKCVQQLVSLITASTVTLKGSLNLVCKKINKSHLMIFVFLTYYDLLSNLFKVILCLGLYLLDCIFV